MYLLQKNRYQYMEDKFTALKSLAATIRDASTEKENTAKRLGGFFIDFLDTIETFYNDFQDVTKVVGIPVSWNSDSKLYKYTTQGVYIISGARNSNDGLPDDINVGSQFCARLIVLSLFAGEVYYVIQRLLLIDNGNRKTKVYIRSGSASSVTELHNVQSNWSTWKNTTSAFHSIGIERGTMATKILFNDIYGEAIAPLILNPSSETTAGLMTAADKEKLNKCVVEADLGNAVYDIAGTAGDSNYTLKLINKSGETVVTRSIPEASVYNAGLLSKDKFIGLSNLLSKQLQEVNSITWGSTSHINNFIRQGVYIISGERTSNIDGLPIGNAASGHTISGRLYVLDSAINSSEVCITQILMLSNRVGTDGNVYLRTGNASSYAALMSPSSTAWEEWQTLQGIKMVGTTTSVNSYVDNGLYSGILTDEATQFDSFVLLVINNYSISAYLSSLLGVTIPKQCTQFLYSLPVALSNGMPTNDIIPATVRIRTGIFSNGNYLWGKWGGLGTITLD